MQPLRVEARRNAGGGRGCRRGRFARLMLARGGVVRGGGGHRVGELADPFERPPLVLAGPPHHAAGHDVALLNVLPHDSAVGRANHAAVGEADVPAIVGSDHERTRAGVGATRHLLQLKGAVATAPRRNDRPRQRFRLGPAS